MKEESEEEYLPQKRYRRSKKVAPAKSTSQNKAIVNGISTAAKPIKWSFQENSAYVSFLEENAAQFVSYLQKKRARTFILMSQIVKTRDSYQCKSHHQKMMKKYGSIAQILIRIPRNAETRKESPSERENVQHSDNFQDVQNAQNQNQRLEEMSNSNVSDKIDFKKGLDIWQIIDDSFWCT